jgi:hypothetical protein
VARRAHALLASAALASAMPLAPLAPAAPAAQGPLTLPVSGRLLVEAAPFGAAVVAADGSVTRLGEWYDSAWAPDGGGVAAVRGDELAVIDAAGAVQWRLRRAEPVQPDWSPDGRRLAYRSGGVLRVVGADGRGDRAVARGLRFAGPRWRPGARDQLAWVDERGSVRVRGAWRSAPGLQVRPYGLLWSQDGKFLAAISGSYVRIFDGDDGRLLRRVTTRRHNHFQFGTFAGDALILVRHDFTRGTSRVSALRSPRAGERTLFAGRGTVGDVTASPGGTRLLMAMRGRDEWRFVPLSGRRTTVAVQGVTRRLNPQATGLWAFPHTRGWRP